MSRTAGLKKLFFLKLLLPLKITNSRAQNSSQDTPAQTFTLDETKFKILVHTVLQKVREEISLVNHELSGLQPAIIGLIICMIFVFCVIFGLIVYVRRTYGERMSTKTWLKWCLSDPFWLKPSVYDQEETTVTDDEGHYRISVIGSRCNLGKSHNNSQDGSVQNGKGLQHNKARRGTYQKESLPIELRKVDNSKEGVRKGRRASDNGSYTGRVNFDQVHSKSRRNSLMSIGVEFFDKLPNINNWMNHEDNGRRYSWDNEESEVDLYEQNNFTADCLEKAIDKRVQRDYPVDGNLGMDLRSDLRSNSGKNERGINFDRYSKTSSSSTIPTIKPAPILGSTKLDTIDSDCDDVFQ